MSDSDLEMEQNEQVVTTEGTENVIKKLNIAQLPFNNPEVLAPGSPRRPIYYKQDNLESTIKALIKPMQTQLDNTQELLMETRQDLETEINENELLRERIYKLEGFGRRHNLRFYKIREQTNESKKDCKQHLLNILHQADILIPPKAIESAHRVGPNKYNPKSQPRYILAKLFHLEEKEQILLRSHQIRNLHGVIVEEDFPPEIESRRKTLRPVVTAAKNIIQNGKKKYTAKLNVDMLIVNGKKYTTKETDQLPEDLQLSKLATPTCGNTTAFFTANSPLSNHHLAKQTVNGKRFNCNEQFYMYSKATKFNDHVTAKKILQEKRPGQQKFLGDHVKGFVEKIWKDCCQEVMKTGLQAKFTQNEHLKDYLLSTGNNQLVEGNPKDSYWGAGLSIHHPKIWEKNGWVGKATNHLGRLLHEIRLEIKRDQ